jgi:PAS domain S-box-containing protein
MDHMMSTTTQIEHLKKSEMLHTLLETLPGALFVVDGTATIMYANASAQTLTGATPEQLVGTPLWRGALQMVSIALYQAIKKTKQTRAPTEVEYALPVTHNRLLVQLIPTVDGLLLYVHEQSEPLPGRETLFPNDHLTADVGEPVWRGQARGCGLPRYTRKVVLVLQRRMKDFTHIPHLHLKGYLYGKQRFLRALLSIE